MLRFISHVRRHLIPARAVAVATALVLASTSSTPARLLDDFEDGDLVGSVGLSWIVLTDELFGGASRATLRNVAPGADGSAGAMQLTGRTVRGDVPLVLAGAWVSLGPAGNPIDLSSYDRLRFRVRGDGIPLEVGLRCSDAKGGLFNAMAGFEARPDWRVVELPLTSFRAQPPADGAAPPFTKASYLGFASPFGIEGEFSIEVDDLELLRAAGAAEPGVPSLSGAPVLTSRVDLAPSSAQPVGPWTIVAADSAGDGSRPGLPDARRLESCYDEREDRLWFRVALEHETPAEWFGLNVAVDADCDQTTGPAWWGANSSFHWDRLVTAYLIHTDSGWQGSVGVADSAGVARLEMGSLAREEVVVGVDGSARMLFVGVPRRSLDDDLTMNVIATVGSAMAPNDDVPNVGGARITWEPAESR